MKKFLIFLCLWIILICAGCRNNEDSRIIEKDDVINMENSQNKNVANENIPTEDIDSINKTSALIIKDEVENNDLVTTNVDILSSSKLLIQIKLIMC